MKYKINDYLYIFNFLKRENKKRFFLFFFLGSSFFLYPQKPDIRANVEMDFFGNLYVDATINNLNLKQDTLAVHKDILIHKKYASIIRGITTGNYFISEYLPKTKTLSYVISIPNREDNLFMKRPDFFLTSLNYLPYKKTDYNKKKKFDINFDLPKKYKVIYPDELDLKKGFYYTPSIIAGNFENLEVRGFKMYSLKKDTKKRDVAESMIEIVDDSYSFYQINYKKRDNKPKIIFLPLEGSTSARTIRDAIIIDSNLLNDTIYLQKRLMAHEVAHLWWGTNGVTVDNPFIVEGVAEYMAVKYMEYRGEEDYVERFLNTKFYRTEGIESSSEIYNTKKVKKEKRTLLNYDFAPLLFFNLESNKKDLYEKLSEFHEKHIDYEGEVPLQKLELFLEEKGFQPLIKEGVLPDFFVVEKNDKIIIQGFNDFTEEVEIEFTDVNDNKSIETLSFSKETNLYKFDSKNYKKIVVDPEYKILQFSRLNDVWTKGEKSVFSKNRYFSLEETKPDVISISTEFINYIESKNNIEISNLTCEDNLWLIKKIEKLKEEINKDGAFTITGGSTYYRESENSSRIDIKLAYFSEKEQQSKFAYFYLYYDKELKFLQNFRAMYPVEID